MSQRLIDTGALGERIAALKAPFPHFCAVLRLQSRLSRVTSYAKHNPALVDNRLDQGMGLELFASGSRHILVSSDQVSRDSLERLIASGLHLLEAHPEVPEGLPLQLPDLRIRETRFMAGENVIDAFSTEEQLEEVHRAHEVLYLDELPQTRGMTTTFVAVEEEWRIFRSDGSDVHFNFIRTSFSQRVTLSEGGQTTTLQEADSGHDSSIMRDEERFRRFAERVRLRVRSTLAALRGVPLPAGHYHVILDAGLSKGLVHEALGHASESDRIFDGSALTQAGRYRLGERIAAPGLTVTDGPLAGGWADQPFSALGYPRARVNLVTDGVLTAGLTDPFTGPAVSLPTSFAERVERYDMSPMPRMTHTWLSYDRAVPWDRTFGSYSPEEAYEFLLEHKLVERSEPWLLLEGYRGGQVNVLTGDFVFQCTVIHRLHEGQVTTHPPAIFSGQVLRTLKALSGAVGPLELHRHGLCGKDGQQVPSSGGGHLMTLFNACEGFVIGGTGAEDSASSKPLPSKREGGDT